MERGLVWFVFNISALKKGKIWVACVLLSHLQVSFSWFRIIIKS